MRRILIGSAAAILAMTFAAAPAMAQYGGSPDEQVEGPAASDEGDALDPDDLADVDDGAEVNDAEDDGAEPYAAADVDVDVDVDPDNDVDIDPENQAALEDEGPAPVPEEQSQGDTWQGEDGRSYCRRSDGTTGLLVGGGAGALVGRGVDSHGRRGTGTIIGAIAGALVGSAIERSANDQRCR